MKIIVADDEADMRDYLRAILTHWGHQVVAVADDGVQLVEYCRACRPDLIITDLRMPNLNGDDAIREIWKQAAIPVILISAYLCPEELANAAAYPSLRYLNKPINRNKLRETLNTLPTISQ